TLTSVRIDFKFGHFTATFGELLNNASGIVGVNFDDNFLDRLQTLTVFVLTVNNAGLRYLHLETFSTHFFEQNSKVHFATTGNYETFRRVAGFNTQRNVLLQFAVQTIFDLASGEEFTFRSCKRTIVD